MISRQSATYRLQFNGRFTFKEGCAILDYLSDLGITAIYSSPILKSHPGSAHGYDTVDYDTINPELERKADFETWALQLKKRGLDLIVDIVPNHMRVNSNDNSWWRDLLKYGQKSKYRDFFDIDWKKSDKIILPLLERPPEEARQRGEFKKERGYIALKDLKLPLDPVTGKAHFVLEYWREGITKINYRRFFDISDLVCLQIERKEVFDAVHKKILELISKELVTGLRIDHIDGLKNPEKYLRTLRKSVKKRYFYIIAEKILLGKESLEQSWPLQGTTGYEFLNSLNKLFVENRGRIVKIYHDFIGRSINCRKLIIEAKKYVLTNLFPSEVESLAIKIHKLTSICSIKKVKKWLIDVIAAFPVYRTYFQSDRRGIVDRFQLLCAPAMAKGLEDTAFYRAFPLASLCEVGGDPYNLKGDLTAFHRQNKNRLKEYPCSLITTTTHDTKRSEDVRARINVLSEIPDLWQQAIKRWRSMVPCDRISDNTRYLLYQTLIGTYRADEKMDSYRERIINYMIKAAREAKMETNWTSPDTLYEKELTGFVQAHFRNPFWSDFIFFLKPVRRAGSFNSLSQALLKIASPGVCDFYQGTEIFDFSLVDPDNRRPVDFSKRMDMLRRIIIENNFREYVKDPESDMLKMYVIWKALKSRKKWAFSRYRVYRALGEKKRHVIAFGIDSNIIMAGRFLYYLSNGFWENCYLKIPSGHYREIFTERVIEVKEKSLLISQAFGYMPLAILERT